MAGWQAVGFAHGVMNTDNMSILGLTLDYGPYGFLDDFDPGFICNHSDPQGRYAFDQQPHIGIWNLACLAQALLPLAQKEDLKAALDRYTPLCEGRYMELMRAKFGLIETKEEDALVDSRPLGAHATAPCRLHKLLSEHWACFRLELHR